MMLENPWGTRHSCQRTTCCRPLPVDCGEPGLDDHLRKQALLNHVQGGSRSSSPLATTQWWAIKPSRRQRSPVRRFPGKVRRNTPEPIPAILLARLAVDRKEQGQGVGAALLRDAVVRTVEAAEQVDVRILLVHALNDTARDFHQRYEFDVSPSDSLHLFLLIEDARAALH